MGGPLLVGGLGPGPPAPPLKSGPDRDMGDVSIKNISDRPFWRDFWGPKMVKNPNALDSTGELTQKASLLPRPPIPGGKGTWSWCTFRSRPFDQASLLYVSRSNLLQSCLLSIVHVNMIIILLIHNNAYSYLLLSCILILKRSTVNVLTSWPSI